MAGGRQLTVTLVANTKSFGAGMADAVRNAEGFKGKMAAIGASLKSVTGPALLGAAAAAGAFAIKLGVDGVQAAMDEQKQLAILKQTLDNVGQGFAMDSVNTFIDNLRFATGVADDELRPAFEKIVGVTKDAASAQDLLAAAVDASVGASKPLESVSAAVAKAIGGQSTALRKLIPGLDTTKIKAGDATSVIAALEDRFGGSAAAAAGTFAGSIQRLKDGFNELTESFGTGFLGAMDQGQSGMGDMAQTLRDMQPAAETLGKTIGEVTFAISGLSQVIQQGQNIWNSMPAWMQSVVTLANNSLNPIANVVWNLSNLGKVTAQTAEAEQLHTEWLQRQADRFVDTSKSGRILTEMLDGQTTALDSATNGTVTYTDEMSLLRAEINRTTVKLGFLAAAFDEANAAMERRQAMQDYRDALKTFIEDPSGSTRDAAVQAMMDVAASMTDPKEQAKFVSKAFDAITSAAADAGVRVPPDLAKIGSAASDQLDPVASLKQAMEEIPNYIPIKIDLQLPPRTMVDSNGNGIPDILEATGGPVYASGGFVGAAVGTHASDSIRARLSRGEYVLNADTVKRLGVGTLNSLNNGGGMGSGLTINGGITVQSVAGERAEESVPRALRRLAFVAGLNG